MLMPLKTEKNRKRSKRRQRLAMRLELTRWHWKWLVVDESPPRQQILYILRLYSYSFLFVSKIGSLRFLSVYLTLAPDESCVESSQKLYWYTVFISLYAHRKKRTGEIQSRFLFFFLPVYRMTWFIIDIFQYLSQESSTSRQKLNNMMPSKWLLAAVVVSSCFIFYLYVCVCVCCLSLLGDPPRWDDNELAAHWPPWYFA